MVAGGPARLSQPLDGVSLSPFCRVITICFVLAQSSIYGRASHMSLMEPETEEESIDREN
jgi:hypothetical protein